MSRTVDPARRGKYRVNVICDVEIKHGSIFFSESAGIRIDFRRSGYRSHSQTESRKKCRPIHYLRWRNHLNLTNFGNLDLMSLKMSWRQMCRSEHVFFLLFLSLLSAWRSWSLARGWVYDEARIAYSSVLWWHIIILSSGTEFQTEKHQVNVSTVALVVELNASISLMTMNSWVDRRVSDNDRNTSVLSRNGPKSNIMSWKCCLFVD